MRLALDYISRHFETLRGSVKAVRDVSLHVEEGEFFVLLGPSGCGKSTLLNLVAGLEKPSNGKICFGEKIVADTRTHVFLPPRRRNVAMVFQTYALYPHLKVFDNIAFPLRVSKDSRTDIEKAVKSIAGMLDIENLLGRKPAELSGGQRQRVAIARALVRRPRLFLLDEPLSNLDAQMRTRLRLELKNLQRELSITTLYVTHDQTEAMTLADRIALMKDGSLVQVGTPHELYERPMNPFAATFIGSPPMNLIPGKLIADKRELAVILFGNRIRLTLKEANFRQHPDSDEILVGIRPEHIELEAQDPEQVVETRLAAIESLGRETLLHLKTDNGHLTALSATPRYKIGQKISISLEPDQIHIFQKEGNRQHNGYK
jgi:multiple sugar transport system ATP-binding protein